MTLDKHEIGNILADPLGRDWSLQGLGMLRLYLTEDKSERLHVWSDLAKYDNVSELHTHPWDMTSLVVAGSVAQYRYVVFSHEFDKYPSHMEQKILCGEGGGLCGAPRTVLLREMYPEVYVAGQTYRQKWWEVHRTQPENGAVTIIKRDFTEDPDHAFVYWPWGEEWVTAEPRPATEDEIIRITNNALVRHF